MFIFSRSSFFCVFFPHNNIAFVTCRGWVSPNFSSKFGYWLTLRDLREKEKRNCQRLHGTNTLIQEHYSGHCCKLLVHAVGSLLFSKRVACHDLCEAGHAYEGSWDACNVYCTLVLCRRTASLASGQMCASYGQTSLQSSCHN